MLRCMGSGHRARLASDGLIRQPVALRETFFSGVYRLWTVISHSVPSGLPVATSERLLALPADIVPDLDRIELTSNPSSAKLGRQ